MRYLDLETVRFGCGSHPEPSGAPTGDRDLCIMEAVAYMAHEPWSDRPQCACPVMTSILVIFNDGLLDDADRDRLLPAKEWIPLLLESRSTDAVTRRRHIMSIDWLVHTALPIWARDSSGPDLKAYSDALQELPPLDASEQSLRLLIEKVKELGRPRYLGSSLFRLEQAWLSGVVAVTMCRHTLEGAQFGFDLWQSMRSIELNMLAGVDQVSPANVAELQQGVVDLLKRLRAVTADDLSVEVAL